GRQTQSHQRQHEYRDSRANWPEYRQKRASVTPSHHEPTNLPGRDPDPLTSRAVVTWKLSWGRSNPCRRRSAVCSIPCHGQAVDKAAGQRAGGWPPRHLRVLACCAVDPRIMVGSRRERQPIMAVCRAGARGTGATVVVVVDSPVPDEPPPPRAW